MGQNENFTGNSQSPFNQTHSAAIRIWHWLTFITITFIILTILFASTSLNPRNNSPVIKNMLKEKGVEISDQQSFQIAHFFDDKMWDLHKLLGYGLAFLVLSRIIIEVTLSSDEKVKTRIKNALSLYKQPDSDKKELKHYLIVKYSYAIFYVIIIYMVLSGLTIAFGRDLGIPREIGRPIKEIHGFCQYLIYLFVFFHICGVIYADLGKVKGIVSGMINGGKS